jgi:hypothetical protein
LMDYTLIRLSVKLNIKISTLSAIIMKTKWDNVLKVDAK